METNKEFVDTAQNLFLSTVSEPHDPAAKEGRYGESSLGEIDQHEGAHADLSKARNSI